MTLPMIFIAQDSNSRVGRILSGKRVRQCAAFTSKEPFGVACLVMRARGERSEQIQPG